MMQTYEAVINTDGKVTLVDYIKLNKPHRALVKVLEEPAEEKVSAAEMAQAKARLARFAGAVKSGNPNSSDNELIDADLAQEYLNPHEGR